MHVFVVFDVLLFYLGNEIIANCYELADVQTMVEGLQGLFGSIQHQRTELTQLGHI